MARSLARGAPKQFVRDWRVELRVTQDGAEGLMGGYLDIERLHLLGLADQIQAGFYHASAASGRGR